MELNEFKRLSRISKKGDELIQSAPINTTFWCEKFFRVIKSRAGYEISGYNNSPAKAPRSIPGCFSWFFDDTTSISFPAIRKPVTTGRSWKILYNRHKRIK